jgi:hypothetical protein
MDKYKKGWFTVWKLSCRVVSGWFKFLLDNGPMGLNGTNIRVEEIRFHDTSKDVDPNAVCFLSQVLTVRVGFWMVAGFGLKLVAFLFDTFLLNSITSFKGFGVMA